MARSKLVFRGAAPRTPGSPRRPHLVAPEFHTISRIPKGFFVSFPENEVHSTDAGSTHAVDILAFVEAQEIPPLYFETPYYLAPAPGGERLYALLRETLRSTRHIGIACVVIQAQQHLAVLVPEGQSLVLNTLRWGCDGRLPEPVDCDADDDPYTDSGLMQQGHGTLCQRTSNASGRIQGETGIGALAEQNMKTKKSADIVLQELEGLLEDDDLICEDYLELALRRRSHHPDRHASRPGAPVHLPKHMQRRIRARR